MDMKTAQRLAESEMAWHGLDAQGWTFKWDSARGRNGQTNYTKRTISLSKVLVPLRDESWVRMTIIHEIAHALVGPGHGHGAIWRRKFVELGGDGNRCSSDRVAAESVARYRVLCAKGTLLGYTNRKTRNLLAASCKCHGASLVFLPNA